MELKETRNEIIKKGVYNGYSVTIFINKIKGTFSVLATNGDEEYEYENVTGKLLHYSVNTPLCIGDVEEFELPNDVRRIFSLCENDIKNYITIK